MVQQFRHLPLIDAAGVGVHRDDLARCNGLGGHLGIQEGGQGKFPGQRGHVSGDAAGIGDDGLGLGHHHDKFGRRMPGHQHRAVGEIEQVLVPLDQKGRAAPDAGEGGGAALHQHGIAGHRRDVLEFLAGGGLQDQGPALEHHEAAGLIQGPFHILGTVVVLFQLDAIPRQDLDLVRGQAGLILELRRHRAFVQPGVGIGH